MSERATITHEPLAMSARPARLGLLVPNVEGFSWMRTFEAALAAQVRFWGGSGNLVFPLTPDFTDKELFWAIADAFDADAFLTYAPTLGESRHIAPAWHAEQITRLRAETDSDERFIKEAEDSVIADFELSPNQAEVLRRRLALFTDPGGEDRVDHFNGAWAAPWPLTDILEFNELPAVVKTPLFTGEGAARRLFVTAMAGRMPEQFAAELTKDGSRVVTELDLGPHAWIPLLRDRGLRNLPPLWSLGETGLGLFRTRVRVDAPAVVVAGDSPWDFTLFYALLRLTGRAWWLPSWLARDNGYLLAVGRALEFEPRSEAREAWVTSTSLPARRCRELAARLSPLPGNREPAVGHWREAIPNEPVRLAALDSETRMKQVQVFEGRVLELDTHIPRHPSTTPESYMRWIAEVRGAGWAPVRHSALARRLLPGIDGSHGYGRTSRDSLSYFASDALVLTGARLEATVLRPALSPMDLEEQIRVILESQGWGAEISDKGIYARESMQLFGGFSPLVEALRDPVTRSILEAYRSKEGPGARLSLDGRRYLLWEHLESVPGADAMPRRLLDLGVLSPGFALRCHRCRQIAWHARATVTDRFACERCSLDQPVGPGSTFGAVEPRVSYRLAEVVFQLLANHGELPILAINDQFGGTRRRPNGHCFELDIRSPDGETQEVDLFYADGSSLWLGEASIDPRFDEEKLAFLARLAEALNAHGVLLATSRPAWPDVTIEKAKRAFAKPWPILEMRGHVNTGA